MSGIRRAVVWATRKLLLKIVDVLFGIAALAFVGIGGILVADATTEIDLMSEILETVSRIDEGIVRFNAELDYFRAIAEEELDR